VTCLEASFVKERFISSEIMTPVCFLEEGKHPVVSLFIWLESSKEASKVPELHEVPLQEVLNFPHLSSSSLEIR
jgi:hypothetical protein